MISNYTDYINRFLLRKGLNGAKSPGEHHFVAVYLLPKLFSINGIVPDYVNPDGTKKVIGDIVYFEKGKYNLGIEVKYETIRLTKNEYNNWIVNEGKSKNPAVFIGICTSGIIILPWSKFREAYLTSVGIKNPTPICHEYGAQKSVNVLFQKDRSEDGYIPKGCNEGEAEGNEEIFIRLLGQEVKTLRNNQKYWRSR